MACNQNGQIVLRILKELNKPATLNQIVQHFVKITGIHSPIIKTTVASVLQGGVKNGFIIKKGTKYFAADLDEKVAKGLGFEEKDKKADMQTEIGTANADDVHAGGEENLDENIVHSEEENQGKTPHQVIIYKTRKSAQKTRDRKKKPVRKIKKKLTKGNIVKASKNRDEKVLAEDANDLLLTENKMVENVAVPRYESDDEDLKEIEENLSKNHNGDKKSKRNVLIKRYTEIKKRQSAKDTERLNRFSDNVEGFSTNEEFMGSNIICNCPKCQNKEMDQQD